MSPYVSERTHVRHAIFPALYLRWYRGLLEHTKAEGRYPTAGDRATVAALQEAYGQALDGLDPAKVDRVRRRVERLQTSLLRDHEDRALGPVFLIISYALTELLERGLLALVKGREKRRLDRAAGVAQGLPKAEKWAPVPRKPDDMFAQAMAGRRFDDFAIPQGRVVSGRTHAWVLGAGS